LADTDNIADSIPDSIPALKTDKDFIDSKSCVECHSDIYDQWKKCDHANSMKHADEKNILADFNNVTFIHVGFDDILLLNDDEIKSLINTIENTPTIFDPKKEYANNQSYPNYRYNIAGRKTIGSPFGATLADLVTATFDAKLGILDRLRKNMSAQTQREFDDELKFQKSLKFQRPSNISIAHDRIANVLRQLIKDKKITTNCGTKFYMFRQNNKFKINTDIGEFEIKFTLGIRPLQQYLVATGNGKLQVLPVAWDVNSKRWFHVYPKEQIPKNDQLHWTASAQNWNRMCADCHTTNLQKNFDPKTKKYNTTFSEINVGCHTCHGDCGKHDAIARKHKLLANWNPKIPKEIDSLENVNGAETVKNCAFCHARRRLLQDRFKPPKQSVSNWFAPELIDSNTYYPDGQLLEESFEYGSFIQSKMHGKGVGCVNCHEPHSLELRFQGNRLCTQCHSPSIYDTVKHHFHADSKKPGAQCVECHFPQSTFMVVDPRRDHSIRKPSPALTKLAGTPNACTDCHRDRKKGETLDWANDKVELWYAEKRKSIVGYSDFKPIDEHYSLAILSGKRNELSSIPKLLNVIRNKDNKEYRSAIRASAIMILGRIAVENGVNEVSYRNLFDEILSVCVKSLSDEDVWVRLSAASVIGTFSGELRIKYLTSMLGDSELVVRLEAARALAGQVDHFRNDNVKNLFANVKREYIESQKVNLDQPAAYLNLAVFEYELVSAKIDETNRWLQWATQGLSGKDAVFEESQKKAFDLIGKLTERPFNLYRESIELDANFFPARVNLAMLYNERGDKVSAEREFREALRIEPNNGDVAYSLGLLFAERGKFEESVEMLRRAIKNLDRPFDRSIVSASNLFEPVVIESEIHKSARLRVRYNLGLLLIRMKRFDDAEIELKTIIQSDPQNATFLYALTVLYLQNNQKQKAKKIIDQLINIEPQNPQWRKLKEL
jgi:tetratricopeptide (TPR) repeat protein